jgi:LysM repeat protein
MSLQGIAPVIAAAGTILSPHHQPPPPPVIAVEHVTELTAKVQHAVPDQVYVVQSGDSLWSIAQRFYGSGFRWTDIYRANEGQIANPNEIQVGQELTIPGGSSPAPATASTSAAKAASPEHYVNPIGPGLTPGRVDMGVDYGGAGPVYALGDGTITSLYNSGWPGGAFIGLRLSDSGRYVYYAEDISPAVQVGQTVTAGQVLGQATGGGIEVGWAAPPGTGQTMADYTGQNRAGLAAGDPGYYPTGYGVSFSNLIRSLGGHAGDIGGPVQGAVPPAPSVKAAKSAQHHSSSPPASSSSNPQYYFELAAQQTGMPLAVVKAQSYVESSYGTNDGPSSTGAMGPWQFEPGTWPSYSSLPFSDATNWADSTQAYIALMKQLLVWSHGNTRIALAAYNAGQGNWQAGLGYADQILSIAGQ